MEKGEVIFISCEHRLVQVADLFVDALADLQAGGSGEVAAVRWDEVTAVRWQRRGGKHEAGPASPRE